MIGQAFAADPFARTGRIGTVAFFQVLFLIAVHGMAPVEKMIDEAFFIISEGEN
jgi:hypothetical protein